MQNNSILKIQVSSLNVFPSDHLLSIHTYTQNNIQSHNCISG